MNDAVEYLQVLQTDSFLECSAAALRAILEQDVLNVESECEVLQALLLWAERACIKKNRSVTPAAKRAILGPLLYCIRLSSLQPQTVSDLLSSDILKAEEKALVAEHLESGTSKDSPFCSSQRISLDRTYFHEFCEDRVSTHTVVAGSSVTTEMECSDNIRINTIDVLQLPVTNPVPIFLVLSVTQGDILAQVRKILVFTQSRSFEELFIFFTQTVTQ